jgi:N-methylhydantoinase B
MHLYSSNKNPKIMPSKAPYQAAKAGDRLVCYGPSGGGYGDPFKRPPEAVFENVLDGLLSSEIAREHYGVVIDGGQLDVAATTALRGDRASA